MVSAESPLAALDIGSNTIRLLVARPRDGGLEKLQDVSEFVRLGRGVDATGELQPDRMEAALQAIRNLDEKSHEAGAGTPITVATSAVRDARNRDGFLRRVGDETGIQVRLLSGDEEARLTFLGASMGIDLDGGAIVTDLGGGSAEIIAAGRDGFRWGRSLQLGSGRLSEQFVQHDPPEAGELNRVREHVERTLSDLPPAEAHVAIFTGGTATHIVWLLGKSGDRVQIGHADLANVVEMLSTRPAKAIVDEFGVRPERAEVLPAGVAAIETIARHYRTDGITITQGGIREGTILDALQHRSAREREGAS